MQIDDNIINAVGGGAGVAGMWLVKELGSFLVKWKKASTPGAGCGSYKPSKEWEEYCRGKFEDITDLLAVMRSDHAVMKVKIDYLEQRGKT